MARASRAEQHIDRYSTCFSQKKLKKKKKSKAPNLQGVLIDVRENNNNNSNNQREKKKKKKKKKKTTDRGPKERASEREIDIRQKYKYMKE